MDGHFEMRHVVEDMGLAKLGVRLPLVTVIVTNFNYADYIIACLKSVLEQSYTNFKCVIIDDCSTDDSVMLIREFIISHKLEDRFTLVLHDENGGQMAAFKTGLRHSDGTFVVFVDADDLLFANFLATHVDIHLNHMPVAFTSSNQIQINENGEIIAGTHPDLVHNGEITFVHPRPLFKPFWIWATTSSMMFRRSVVEMIIHEGSNSFRVCADNYVCHFANLIGGSLLIPSVHGCYRRHGQNYFSKNPIVGGRLPTGDMRKHPLNKEVRAGIANHLIQNSNTFLPLLSTKRFAYVMACVCDPREILWRHNIYSQFRRFISKSVFIKCTIKAVFVGSVAIVKQHLDQVLRKNL